jgi:hypothetical protein
MDTGENPASLARMAAEREERFYMAARRAIQRTVGVHGDLLSARAAFVFLHGLDSGAIWDTALADAREDDVHIQTQREAVAR